MIKLILEEYMEEMATICVDERYSISIAVNPDANRIGGPYFKFYNSTSYGSAKKVIRILFKKADYVVHKDGKELWKLNSVERKILVKILKSPSNYFANVTNWDVAKYEWNREYLKKPFYFDKYFKGEYDEVYKDEPSYVSSTLEMPNYKTLQF